MKEDSIENAKSQMRKGFLEFCILLIINQEKVYASDILQKLTHADLIVVEGTLYPLLSRLRNQGLLEYNWEESSSGPPRKYYSLTQKGTHALQNFEETWTNLKKSITTLKK